MVLRDPVRPLPEYETGIFSNDHAVGLVDPQSGRWRLFDDRGRLVRSFYYGNPGDYPIMGDWDGDGVETPGLYRQSDGYVYLRNSNTHTQGIADSQFIFGDPGDRIVAGDRTGDGTFTPALFRPWNGTMYFRFTNTQGAAGLSWSKGEWEWIPVAGRVG